MELGNLFIAALFAVLLAVTIKASTITEALKNKALQNLPVPVRKFINTIEKIIDSIPMFYIMGTEEPEEKIARKLKRAGLTRVQSALLASAFILWLKIILVYRKLYYGRAGREQKNPGVVV